jgi:hypothetical protein
MYKRGCLLVSGELIAQPDIFDALIDAFTLVRQLETDEPNTYILIVEHDEFLEVNEGDYLVFYDPIFERVNGETTVKEIGAPYIHTKYFLKCQNQLEAKKQETDDSPLIWLPDQ